jgi:hypothetical protein
MAITVFGIVGVLLSIIPISLWYFVQRVHTTGLGVILVNFAATIFLIAGIILLAVAGLTLFLGYGLWTGRKWAYPLGFAVGTITVLAAFAQFADGDLLGIFDFATGLWTLYSLMKPEVKMYFGRYGNRLYPVTQLPVKTETV